VYTEKGFDPFTLEIKKGQPVRFINLSSRAMRISGEIRGVENYKGLEQMVSLGRGGFYDFAFTQKGVWGYKNLNNEADRGVVVVTE
jgi:plastocyanin